jgi:hypothetical protein
MRVIARFSRGDSVPIAYSRIDPERARIDTLWFNHRWVIGGVIVGLAMTWLSGRRRLSVGRKSHDVAIQSDRPID